MRGLAEIKEQNLAAVADLPQTRRETNFRVQRDRLAQAVTRLLAKEAGAEDFARKVLGEINAK